MPGPNPTEGGAPTSNNEQGNDNHQGQGNTLNGIQHQCNNTPNDTQQSQPIQLSDVLRPGTRSENLGLDNFSTTRETTTRER